MKTLLIANRGEIAVRVIRTAKQQGLRTVAVFSETDRHAPHVDLADTAVCLGDGPVAKTYLDQDKILAAMTTTGADAVHPGYGFLSENAEFAERVMAAGWTWVGPPVDAMKAMASKARAKQTLEPKGVPMIPGYHGDDQSDATLTAEALTIGFPLLVKASAGGGGKGMKVAESEAELSDALQSARREAENSFGDDRLLLEKFLVQPRHIEVQILADQHGNVVSLFERDCSVQRRHQKVLEEAPAPNLSQSLREQMWLAAETTAREIGYEGAGTVEFILSTEGEFYFLEMNTRLQVEHPVTECITGQDLVAWQLNIARGETLPPIRPVEPIGHAIEARFYAEDPAQNFLPMVGHIHQLTFPQGDGIRIDSGVYEQTDVSSFYDPMLAKVIVHADNREAALLKMRQVLAQTRCFGLTTNLGFLRHLIEQPEVQNMTVHTRWLDEQEQRFSAPNVPEQAGWAALAAVLHQCHQPADDAFTRHRGWRMNGQRRWTYALSEQTRIEVVRTGRNWQIDLPEGGLHLEQVSYQPTGDSLGELSAQSKGRLYRWAVYVTDDSVWLDDGHQPLVQTWWRAEKAHDHDVDVSGREVAALPGTVTALYKQPGDHVRVGDKLLSYEAMKMETTLMADVDGVLSDMSWQVGDQIGEGDLLYDITATADAEENA
ncbi:acetyl/propionyl/methylcrotonyl-CoA carboxylase subunit alpha [Reinekea blandensis]|uniref:Biotin carboxylase n=1 Tax=Reinekea blandensis MED297 TaxID=314283 RepID=A4B8T6_9GAMM|nr:biotin carboxylase N-terminal domain-containing protein [Reinekea blandensis]EAR11037.1 Acetyl/propionyl-CoA carboxylase, alpha subunit [Reinekea sp. MED297] [Reinekea blandensis MED297]